MKNDIPTELNC